MPRPAVELAPGTSNGRECLGAEKKRMDDARRCKGADDVAPRIHSEHLRSRRTWNVERGEDFLPEQIAVIAATRDGAGDVAPGVNAEGGGGGRAGHIDRVEHVLLRRENRGRPADCVVPYDPALWTDGATGRERGTGTSIVSNSPSLNRKACVTPAATYRPTMSPRALIPVAARNVAPGYSIVVNGSAGARASPTRGGS